MPKLKEPSSLKNIALDVLLEYISRYCDQIGDICTEEMFREGLSVIRRDVFSQIPWYMMAECLKKFHDKFTLKEDRPKWQYTFALEMMMDAEIEGLRCGGPILKYLDPKQGHRLRRLVELDLSYYKRDLRLRLKRFHLKDLIVFVYPNCTNSELKAIGRNCPQLQVLKLQSANEVTNRGIRYLDSLHELRVLDIVDTNGVNYRGVNHVLAVHDKLEEFSYGQNQDEDGFVNGKDFLSKLDMSVQCPSIRRFTVKSAIVGNVHLRSIVAKFPYLTHLEITQSYVDDLSDLRFLYKLESIELSLTSIAFDDEYPSTVLDPERTWLKLKHLLTLIGANIKTLKFICIGECIFLNQDGFDFIFKYCPKMKSLKLNHGFADLTIPPFPNMTDLSLRVRTRPRDGVIRNQLLRFPEMLELENLELYNFGLDLESVRSIVTDSKRFPKLKFLAISSLTAEEAKELELVTRNKNLDIRVLNVEATCYVRTYLG